MTGPRRYAIFFAPAPGTPLAEFGNRWLGRDPFSGEDLAQPHVPGLDARRLVEITQSPWRYGFHATLKPPFALKNGATAAELDAVAGAFAEAHAPCEVPLKLDCLAGFLALVPAAPVPELDALAADCVRAFDRFRAPPDEAELARRRAAGLTPRQDELLLRWGYPYVLEEFRCHMTLTERLADPERASVMAALETLTAPLSRTPLRVDAICLFEQPDRDSPMLVTARYPFGNA